MSLIVKDSEIGGVAIQDALDVIIDSCKITPVVYAPVLISSGFNGSSFRKIIIKVLNNTITSNISLIEALNKEGVEVMYNNNTFYYTAGPYTVLQGESIVFTNNFVHMRRDKPTYGGIGLGVCKELKGNTFSFKKCSFPSFYFYLSILSPFIEHNVFEGAVSLYNVENTQTIKNCTFRGKDFGNFTLNGHSRITLRENNKLVKTNFENCIFEDSTVVLKYLHAIESGNTQGNLKNIINFKNCSFKGDKGKNFIKPVGNNSSSREDVFLNFENCTFNEISSPLIEKQGALNSNRHNFNFKNCDKRGDYLLKITNNLTI